MKKLLLILIFTLFCLPVNADIILQGEVKYNVDSARDELKSSAILKHSKSNISNHFLDANYNENISYILKGQVSLKDRELAFFSDGSYGVIYNKNKLEVFYYRQNGQLMNTELRSSLEYPYKSYKYDIAGNLVNMGLRISKEETYIYTPDGILIAHWIKNLGYDTKGNVIMTRKYVE